ncbi:MAG TPA: outer membrane lipid asymmetry maintenance protein MlaD [Oleiagrimonas sp.]|nr:outer membrane lipid asymmetry maintenance protein MlaD [Oleiagrimonas sp.]
MNPRRSFAAGTGLFILLGFAALVFLATQTTSVANNYQGDTYTVTADFMNVGQLKVGAPVKMAGVRIGSVTAITLDQKSLLAQVTMAIGKRFNAIPADSSAAVFTSGLLGDQYIAVKPGSGINPDDPTGPPLVLHDGSQFIQVQSALQLEDLIGKFLVDGSPAKK